MPAAAGRSARTPHTGGKICAPYSVVASRSTASAAVTTTVVTARIGADRRCARAARNTSSDSSTSTTATV